MKKCPFCAEEIQDAAVVCKHCGRDLPGHGTPPTPATPPTSADAAAAAPKTAQQNAGIGCAVILLLLFGSCVWMLSRPQSPEQQRANALSNARATTTVLCEEAMTKQLRSPGSADYPFGHVSTVTEAGPNRYQLRSYVDSQNAFGATLRTAFLCVVEGHGTEMSNYRVVDLKVLQ